MSLRSKILSKLHISSKRNLATIWLISYIAIFIVPVIINVFISFSASNILLSQSMVLANEVIKRNQDDLNSLWEKCDDTFQLVYLNEEIRQTVVADKAEPFTPLQGYDLKNTLASLLREDDMVSDIQLVFHEQDAVVSTNRFLSTEEFFSISGEGLFPASSTPVAKEFFEKKYSGNLVRTLDSFAYLKTLVYPGESHNHATLIVRVQPMFMHKNCQALFNGEGLFLLFDKNGELIFANKEASEKLLQEFSTHAAGDNDFRFAGENYVVYESEGFNSRQVYLLPRRVVLRGTKSLNVIILIANAVTLLLGFFMISRFLKRNLRPVQDILALLDKKPDSFENEFNLIVSSLEEKQLSASELTNKLKAFRPLVVRSVLEKLLFAGELDSEMGKKLDISFENPNFFVILTDITSMGDLESEDDSIDQTANLAFVALSNIFSEVLAPLGSTCCGLIDRTIIFILNTAVSSEETILQTVDKAYELLQNHLGIRARVVVSPSAQMLQNLPAVYQQSLNALEYMTIMEEIGVSPSMPSEVSLEFSYSDHTDLFISQILNVDRAGANATINSLIKENSLLQPHISKYNLTHVLIQALRKLTELNNLVDSQTQHCNDMLKTIMSSRKLSDVKELVEQFVDELCTMAAQWHYDSEDIVKEVRRYIDKNYMKCDINVKIISGIFAMTPSYLSSKFKQTYGMSILEYINQVRIERAKELLRTTNTSLESVYQSCGYISKDTFLRQFKKMCEITPAMYRKNAFTKKDEAEAEEA